MKSVSAKYCIFSYLTMLQVAACSFSPSEGQLKCDQRECPTGWYCNERDHRCYSSEFWSTESDTETPDTDKDSDPDTDSSTDVDSGGDTASEVETDTETGVANNPPAPNPATFAIAPFAVDDTTITMRATTGVDSNGPVEYRFIESSGNIGATNSAWQLSPSYIDTELAPNTEYTYLVQMRDGLGLQGLNSVPASATTLEGPLAGLIQHLDATRTETITVNGSKAVTLWKDLSAAGNDAARDKGDVIYPSSTTSSSGLVGLDLGSGQNSLVLFDQAGSRAWLNQSAGTGGFAFLIAFTVDGLLQDNWNDLIGNGSNEIARLFGMRWSSSGTVQAYLGGTPITRLGGYELAPGDTVVYTFNYDASTGTYAFWDSKNGSAMTGTVAAADFTVKRNVTLGTTNNDLRYCIATVGEILVFDRALAEGRLTRLQNHLVAKWVE